MMRLVGGRNRLKTTKENGLSRVINQFAVNLAHATRVVQFCIYVNARFFAKFNHVN